MAQITTAPAPLTIPTSDGSGEAVHPDVYDAGTGQTWNGYRYWMVMTPYKDDDASLENPEILASGDGNTWVVPAGLTNPIEPYPGAGNGFYADPDLIRVGNSLYCIFRLFTGETTEIVYEKHSADGITWSDKVEIFRREGESSHSCVSPAALWDGTQYRIYTINATNDTHLLQYRTAPAITGPWSDPVSCTITRNAVTILWHLDVVLVNGKYYAIICDDYNAAYFAISSDGAAWDISNHKNHTGGTWDNIIYRGSLVYNGSDFDYWYSARDSVPGSGVWGIGRTKVTGGLIP